MAFLNVISLSLMFKKLLDIMAFNETRLDSSITDSMTIIDTNVILRKDRLRRGGGVCSFIRGSITYCVTQDLVPSELEAVWLEIIKPLCQPFFVICMHTPLKICII